MSSYAASPACRLQDLPPELIRTILIYLCDDVRTLLALSATSPWLRDFSRDQLLWKSVCEERLMLSARPYEPRDWRKFFQKTYKLAENWAELRGTKFELPLPNHPNEGHEDGVYALQVQGRYLVSGSLDKTVRIWNLRTLRLIGKPLRGHQEAVLCLQFDSRDGRDVIISGDKKGDLIAWSLSTAKIINKIDNAHRDAIAGLKFDQSFLVTASKDLKINVWELRTLCTTSGVIETSASPIEPYTSLTGHAHPVNAVDLFGDTVVSASADHIVKIWSISQRACLASVMEPRSIACVYFDGGTIISGGKYGSLRLYDRCLQLKESMAHGSPIRAVSALLNDHSGSGLIVSGCQNGSVRVWRKTRGRKWRSQSLAESTLEESSRPILSLHCDHRRLAYCPNSSKIVGWDMEDRN